MRLAFALILSLVPFAAQADDDESPARVSVVQRRQYTLHHEISVAGGVLPLDAFYKGITINAAYTYHFNDHFAWRVGRFMFDGVLDTGLKQQLNNQFGVLTTDFPEVQWIAGSDLVWNAFYGKTAFMNAFVLHLALYLVLGADAVKTQKDVLPAANFGGGIRFFITEWMSARLEASNHFVIGKSELNVLDLQLGLSVNLGS